MHVKQVVDHWYNLTVQSKNDVAEHRGVIIIQVARHATRALMSVSLIVFPAWRGNL